MNNTEHYVKSMECSANLGILAGYDNAPDDVSFDAVRRYIASILEEYYQETGIYVSFIVTPAHAVYREKWGCPKGGEPVVNLSAVYNKYYCTADDYSISAWKGACLKILEHLKEKFDQTTLTVVFKECEVFYMHDSNDMANDIHTR